MKISSINSYNYASFGVRKTGKYANQDTNTNKTTVKKIVQVGGIGLATAATVVGAALVPGCTNGVSEATPPSAYVDSTGVIPNDEVINETIAQNSSNVSSSQKISTLPQSEREAVWHEVKKGDRLADIVKEYAELHQLTPDEELVPYYELLEADNPGKWEDRNTIWIGTRIRVDAIMPQNRVTTQNDSTISSEPSETQTEEVEPTEAQQVTTDKDKVEVNGNIFTFDANTMDKTFLGDYEGLMFGKYAVIDVKLTGGMVLKKYEGVTSKTDLSQKIEYDKDGKITEIVDYKNDKPVTVSSYAYKMNSTVETVVDKTAKLSQIDEIVTEYDNSDDIINSRQFLVNGKTVASFNFSTKSVQIGDEVWNLEQFECNDDAIGSKKYTGIFNGQIIRFDVLKNGFCVEYVDSNGEIEAREQYDSLGELMAEETVY